MGKLQEGLQAYRRDRQHRSLIDQATAKVTTTRLLTAAMAGTIDRMGSAIRDSWIELVQANAAGRDTRAGRSHVTTASSRVADVDLFIDVANRLMDQVPYGSEAKKPGRRGFVARLFRRPRRQVVTI